MDAIDIMKLAGGICGEVLVKDYGVYRKWINEWYNNKILWTLKAIKLHDTILSCWSLGQVNPVHYTRFIVPQNFPTRNADPSKDVRRHVASLLFNR